MASPFAVFRRNQKVLTVILTCLAMFAFIILDSVSKMDSSAIIPIVFGLAGAALAWLWGSQNERGISYSTIGFGAVAGVVAGAIFIFQATNQGGISTSLGKLSARDLFEMKQKRDTANQFVAGAFRERTENAYGFLMERYMFGQTSNRDVVVKMLLDHEADRLGIAISDEHITKFINEVSDNNINRKKLTKLRSQMGLGESELYDLLRSELRAQVAYQVLNPEIVHMPDQYWADFEKLNVRHSIDAVAIPVEPFAERLDRPSDSELKELFEAFKATYPMGENPGFLQPDRLKLAWFESDYESAENMVGEIPEDELKARYEERKEIDYKIEALPDFGSELDDGGLKFGEPPAPTKTTPPTGDDKETEGTPKADDTKTDPAAEPEGDAPAEPAKKEDSPPVKEDAPEEKTPSRDEPEASDDAKKESPEVDAPSECGDGDDQESDETSDEKKTEEPAKPAASETKPAAEPKEDSKPEQPSTENKAATEKAAADKAPADKSEPEKPASDKAAALPDDASKESTEEPADTPESEVKYRAFEDVRDEIRDLMLREKTEAIMAENIAQAMAAVNDWRFQLREETPGISDDDLAKAITEKAEAYCAEYGLKIAEEKDAVEGWRSELREATPDISDDKLAEAITEKAITYSAEYGLKFVNPDEFFSQQELIDHKEYEIGTAQEPFDPSNFTPQSQLQTVASILYTGATSLFIPEEAEGQFDDTRYAFWASGEKEQHIPTLEEPGIREQVEKAARLKNARPEAEARAQELAKAVQEKFAESSIVSLTEGVAGQTILGAAATEQPKPETDEAATTDGPATEEESGGNSDADKPTEDGDSCGDEEGQPEEAELSAPKLVENAPELIEEEPAEETTNESLSVISSPPFTWYRQSSQGMQMNPFAQPTVEFGFIPGIDGVDNNFMQEVANAAVGDVVVIPNATKTIYYLIHVKARNPAGIDDPSLNPVRQQFITENAPMSPIYGQLARSQASEIHQRWMSEFLAKHKVDVVELDAI